jgi:hypothetical protein
LNFNIISHKDIDKQKWSKLLAKYNSIENQYSSFWYISSATRNWSAFVLDDYSAVFPFAHENKNGYNVVFQPFFTRFFPFIGNVNKEFIDMVYNYLFKNFKFLDINSGQKLEYPFLHTKKCIFQYLELNNDYETIQNSFSKNTKRILKKIDKFSIQKTTDSSLFINLFKETVGKKLNYKKEHYNALSKIIKQGVLNNQIEILQIQDTVDVLAYGVFYTNYNTINYLKGAVTQNGKKAGAMYALINYCIKQNSNTNKYLDFGGSNVKSVSDFYKKFGAKDEVYFNNSFDKLPLIVKSLKKIKTKYHL